MRSGGTPPPCTSCLKQNWRIWEGRGINQIQHLLLPAPSEVWDCQSHCSIHMPTQGQGHGGGFGFVRASPTTNVHGKPFLKGEGSRFLNPGLLLEVCFFFNVSKIHLTYILTPCKCNCNSRETSACRNSPATCRTPTRGMIFIPWFQSQAREQVYEGLIPPYMAAVSSHFFQQLHFSFSSSTPSFPSI